MPPIPSREKTFFFTPQADAGQKLIARQGGHTVLCPCPAFPRFRRRITKSWEAVAETHPKRAAGVEANPKVFLMGHG